MNSSPPPAFRPLGGLPILARLGATGFVLVALLGLWASMKQIEQHHGKNDGEPGVSLTDVVGAYHGAKIPAPMRSAVEGTLAGHGGVTLEQDERAAMLAWLDDGRAAEMFDDIDLDDMAPVEILARRCGECHSSSGGAPPFDTFADVKATLSDKELVPTPPELQLTSLHSHAPGMVAFGLVLALAALVSRFGRFLRSLPLALAGIGIALDLGAWLPARDSASLVYAIVAGGALFAAGCALACALVLLEVWLPCRHGASATGGTDAA
ncbi:MAG: hypothetical protein R3F34_06755 [Planctomycetota bacterium]